MAGLNVGQAPDMAQLRKGSHPPYFTDEESETQRGETACPRPQHILDQSPGPISGQVLLALQASLLSVGGECQATSG